MRSRRFRIASASVGLLLLAIAALAGSGTFYSAYLTAYAFWWSLAIGSLGVLFVQFLTGGIWGLATRRIFEAAIATLPVLAIGFVPIAFGLPSLYIWAQAASVASEPVLQHKALYLNVPFFLVRAVVYWITWIVLATRLRSWSIREEPLVRLQRLSVIGALLLAVTVSFAAIDWFMSLDALWFSTMYPPMVGMNALLLALAFGVLILTWRGPSTVLDDVLTPRVYNDLGSLLLAFLMLWAYMAFFQYLLIWAGNLSDEIPWYLRRLAGGWMVVAIANATLGFLVPFWFLLFRPLKRNRRALGVIAGVLVCMRFVDVLWTIKPPLAPTGPALTWVDLATLLGIGGVWLAVFAWQLAARPLLPSQDPRLVGALEAARAA